VTTWVDTSAPDIDVPVLLVTVAHHTGDYSILRDEFRPDTTNLFDPDAGLTPDIKEQARALASETLQCHLDDGLPQAPPPSRDQLRKAIAFC
jgi:4-hydroxyacetophenone monooxygenase